MCGICGYICKTTKKRPDNETIRCMTDIMAHRGPDAEGWYCGDSVALGHRRLSIIDLSENGKQPMYSHDGRYLISFNGEIYNYLELKEELTGRGAVFKTDTDTEVIIEAYRAYGTECFQLFNGMWGLALLDLQENQLILCRDRFGIKPLYTAENEDAFIFASEIKSIIEGFPEFNEPNPVAIYRYLSGSINENVDEVCFYRRVKIFPSASYMIYVIHSGKKTTESYWHVDEKLFHKKWIEGKEPLQTFKGLFEDAVRIRLRADVEVGACLSGGLDSSAIVGCASKKYHKKMHTFSSIYTDKECDEEAYIRKVNEKWDTIPHYIRPDDDEEDLPAYIERITYYHEQPTGGASLYSQYKVMQGIHEHVKVVLDGQGADELFAGYIPYYSHYIADLMDKNTFAARRKAIRLLTIVMREWPDVIGAVSTDTIVRLVGLKNSFRFQNKDRIKEYKIRRSESLFTGEFMQTVKDNYSSQEIKCSSRLNTRLCNDVLFKSIPALLHNEDGNSMAFSIESRVPFLDYRIVEFAIALDGKYKIKNEWTKWIIRRSLREYLPEEVEKRKNKMGFPAPFARWLREGKCRGQLKEVIYALGKRNIVPENTIDQFYRAHMDGTGDYSDILFKLYNLEIWLQMTERKGRP